MSLAPFKRRIPRALHSVLQPAWERWKRRPHALRRVEVHRPVFVVGHPRSGTSWLYKLLGMHKEFAAAPESHLFDHYLRPFLDEDPFVPWGGLNSWIGEERRTAFLKRVTDDVFGSRLDSEQKKRVVEKTPEHAHHIPEIKRLYPQAQFIHIVRDGRDVMLSVLAYAEHLKNPPKDLIEGAHQWCATLEAVEAAQREFGEDILEVRYEDVAADPGRWIQQIFRFLGEPCTDSLVREILEAYPPSTKSLGKWRTQLTEAQNREFVEVAAEWLDRKGYGESVEAVAEEPETS